MEYNNNVRSYNVRSLYLQPEEPLTNLQQDIYNQLVERYPLCLPSLSSIMDLYNITLIEAVPLFLSLTKRIVKEIESGNKSVSLEENMENLRIAIKHIDKLMDAISYMVSKQALYDTLCQHIIRLEELYNRLKTLQPISNAYSQSWFSDSCSIL